MSLLDNLISYWKLDEASGNALDAHGANDLTDNNTVGSTTGKLNGCRDFVGINEENLSHTDNTDLSAGDIDFSVSLWVRLDLEGFYPFIIGKDNGSTQREWFLFYDIDTDKIAFAVDSGSVLGTTHTVESTNTVSLDTWYHVVAWHDSVNNVIGICVDNGTPNTTAHSTGVPDTSADFSMGRGAGGLQLDGKIDEAGFWKKVLSSQDITDLFNSGTPLPYEDFGGEAEIPTTWRMTPSPAAGTIWGLGP